MKKLLCTLMAAGMLLTYGISTKAEAAGIALQVGDIEYTSWWSDEDDHKPEDPPPPQPRHHEHKEHRDHHPEPPHDDKPQAEHHAAPHGGPHH